MAAFIGRAHYLKAGVVNCINSTVNINLKKF